MYRTNEKKNPSQNIQPTVRSVGIMLSGNGDTALAMFANRFSLWWRIFFCLPIQINSQTNWCICWMCLEFRMEKSPDEQDTKIKWCVCKRELFYHLNRPLIIHSNWAKRWVCVVYTVYVYECWCNTVFFLKLHS